VNGQDARKDHAVVADQLSGSIGGHERRPLRVGCHFVLHRHGIDCAVRLHVAVHRAEAGGVADGRLQQVAGIGRTADHQLAQGDAAGFAQPGMDRVFDGADAIALRNGKLQEVLARRQAGAGGVLERRGHAVHDRLQPRIGGLAVGDASVLIGDDVANRHDL
jgi:hypothetical protein